MLLLIRNYIRSLSGDLLKNTSPLFYQCHKDIHGHKSREKNRYYIDPLLLESKQANITLVSRDIPGHKNIPRELELGWQMHFQSKGQCNKLPQSLGFISYPKTHSFLVTKRVLVICLSRHPTQNAWPLAQCVLDENIFLQNRIPVKSG